MLSRNLTILNYSYLYLSLGKAKRWDFMKRYDDGNVIRRDKGIYEAVQLNSTNPWLNLTRFHWNVFELFVFVQIGVLVL